MLMLNVHVCTCACRVEVTVQSDVAAVLYPAIHPPVLQPSSTRHTAAVREFREQ